MRQDDGKDRPLFRTRKKKTFLSGSQRGQESRTLPYTMGIEEHERLSTFDRRMKIIRIINTKRHVTYSQLADELGVHKRTIRRDIDYLSRHYPIYTQPGNSGGVFTEESYKLSNQLMSDSVSNIILKLMNHASAEERKELRFYLMAHGTQEARKQLES